MSEAVAVWGPSAKEPTATKRGPSVPMTPQIQVIDCGGSPLRLWSVKDREIRLTSQKYAALLGQVGEAGRIERLRSVGNVRIIAVGVNMGKKVAQRIAREVDLLAVKIEDRRVLEGELSCSIRSLVS